MNQKSFCNVVSAPQMRPPHGARLVQMRKTSFHALATLPQQTPAAIALNAPPIAVYRVPFFTPTRPVPFPGLVVGGNDATVFSRGIQTVRTNSTINAAQAEGAYELTPILSLDGKYLNSLYRTSTSLAGPGQNAFLFNTNFQTINVGPRVFVTSRDTVTMAYQYLRSDFSRANVASSFQTHGATLGWTRVLAPTLTASAMGGFTVFQGGNVQYLADAMLEWKYQRGATTVHYSRSVFPSFFIAGLPLLSQLVTVSASYNVTPSLTVLGSGSYAKNESVPNPILSFESYAITGSVTYTINRYFSAVASVTRSNYTSTFAATESSFNRNVASLSLRGEWK